MLKYLFRLILTQSVWRWRLGRLGWRSVLFAPMLVTNAKRIRIGSHSQIRDFARIEVIHRPVMGWDATLTIGDRVNIEQGVHIVCQCEVTIGDDVSITPYCAIVDTYHPHDQPDKGPKIGSRLPKERSYVRIGEGSFIGMKTVILPNVRIGKYCVIGAGSVVDKDIPDYAMAAGSPVHLVSIYNPETQCWS